MSDESIRQRAYELWEKSGGEHGRHEDHWSQAVREIEEAAKAIPGKAKRAMTRPAAKKTVKPEAAVATAPMPTRAAENATPSSKQAEPAKKAAPAAKREAADKPRSTTPASSSTAGKRSRG